MGDGGKIKNSYDYLIVGAGFSGAVLAERIAHKLNKKVLIIDKRGHVGGNCYDYRDQNGILVQKYGPHIFHTNHKKVLNYLSRFTEWNSYKHEAIAYHNGEYYPIPINLDTINKFFNLNLKNERELKGFLEIKRTQTKKIKNSKDVIVSRFGKEIYEVFIEQHTKKQWGVSPQELDKSVLERLPIRYNKNPCYFDDKFQAMPRSGFTKIFEEMLNNKNITLKLNTDFFKMRNKIKYKKLIYTGPIDQFFNYKFGKLQYRRIHFSFETHDLENFQPKAVVNFPDPDVPYTRITEFKKFYNKKLPGTVICKELPFRDEEPAYPVINKKNTALANRYMKKTKELKDVIFIGRLAQYRYLDMDEIIKEALKIFENIYPK